MLDASSGIFNNIKEKILYRTHGRDRLGNHPDTAPQHMNLVDVRAGSHAFRPYVVLNNNFYGKEAQRSCTPASTSHLPLKHFWGIEQIRQRAYVSKWQLDKIAAAQCCYTCYRFAYPTGDGRCDDHLYCPAAGVGACNLRGQAINLVLLLHPQGSVSSSDASIPFESFAESKKRKREDTQRELNEAAEAQRANIKVKVQELYWETRISNAARRPHALSNPKRCYLMDSQMSLPRYYRVTYRGHNQSI